MSTTYFLTFLFALVALSAATAARQSGEAHLAEPRQISSTTRFRSTKWGKIKTHQSKSVDKSPDDMAMQRAKLKLAGARRTMERELGKTIDQVRTSAVSSMSAAGAMNNKLDNINGRAMPGGARPEYFNQKTAKAEWTTRRAAGYRGKAFDNHKYDENMHV